ncbi:hypothetical protein SS50377_26419 [Spironucleus salmonicida]|uniref:Uncharacterized protein n=1 Tax=Spironucleus salmonicida TaxID=348837 RepID=A0A9P8RWZ6_9EUKA|nr:hypothetical protein SS50377_26419 [Spironucleus salmonicida]
MHKYQTTFFDNNTEELNENKAEKFLKILQTQCTLLLNILPQQKQLKELYDFVQEFSCNNDTKIVWNVDILGVIMEIIKGNQILIDYEQLYSPPTDLEKLQDIYNWMRYKRHVMYQLTRQSVGIQQDKERDLQKVLPTEFMLLILEQVSKLYKSKKHKHQNIKSLGARNGLLSSQLSSMDVSKLLTSGTTRSSRYFVSELHGTQKCIQNFENLQHKYFSNQKATNLIIESIVKFQLDQQSEFQNIQNQHENSIDIQFMLNEYAAACDNLQETYIKLIDNKKQQNQIQNFPSLSSSLNLIDQNQFQKPQRKNFQLVPNTYSAINSIKQNSSLQSISELQDDDSYVIQEKRQISCHPSQDFEDNFTISKVNLKLHEVIDNRSNEEIQPLVNKMQNIDLQLKDLFINTFIIDYDHDDVSDNNSIQEERAALLNLPEQERAALLNLPEEERAAPLNLPEEERAAP